VVIQLWEAFQKKDIAIWLGGKGMNPFSNNGLVVAIVSRIPKEGKDLLLAGDLDYMSLKAVSNDTGIEKVIRTAKKSFYALSPKWTKDIKGTEGRTKHRVVYWLNPTEQHIHAAGWFTVEDLELWAKDEGPVMKKGG
jgi:hypothetical protein